MEFGLFWGEKTRKLQLKGKTPKYRNTKYASLKTKTGRLS
jgi:hypothetical protein